MMKMMKKMRSTEDFDYKNKEGFGKRGSGWGSRHSSAQGEMMHAPRGNDVTGIRNPRGRNAQSMGKMPRRSQLQTHDNISPKIGK